MLTLADKGGKQGLENAEIVWQRGEGGLKNDDNTDKSALKRAVRHILTKIISQEEGGWENPDIGWQWG